MNIAVCRLMGLALGPHLPPLCIDSVTLSKVHPAMAVTVSYHSGLNRASASENRSELGRLSVFLGALVGLRAEQAATRGLLPSALRRPCHEMVLCSKWILSHIFAASKHDCKV